MIANPAAHLKAKLFLFIVLLIITCGSLFVYAASSVYAMELFGSAYYFVKKQFIGIVLGLVASVCIFSLSSRFLYRITPLFFISSLVLTALTLIPPFAVRIHGSGRWLKLGVIVIQPSELLKIAFVLYVSYVLSKKNPTRATFRYDFLPLVILLIIPLTILLKQPDFGLTMTLIGTTLLLLFIAQWNARHMIGTLALVLVSTIALIAYYPYRMQRILTFLNPWKDPHGTGFQIIQSLIAIGTGGLCGVGLGQSKQKFFYLPMQHTDFILSIIAEEVGFIGTSILIIFFALFTYLGLSLACQTHTKFAFFTISGFTILISLQSLINMAVATGLAPTKGIGLPFVSYGNSALICHMMMIAIIMRMVCDSSTELP